MKIKAYSYLRELSIVFIGVTSAFVISSQHALKEQEALKSNILSTIKNEQIENIERIDLSIAYNKKMLIQYDSIIKYKENKKLYSNRTITVNIGKCIFNDTGYDLAVQSQILSRVNFEIFKSISWCYKLQKSTSEIQDNYIGHHANDKNSTNRESDFYKTAKNKLKDLNNALQMQIKDAQKLVDIINSI